LLNISNGESIPLDEVSTYIKEKLQEKQKVDQEIKAANDILQKNTVTIEALNEHIQLKDELDRHGISIQDTDKLKNLLSNAKENGFDPRLIVRKLRNIKRLENKENKLKASCELLSKKESKYKEIIPLANIIWDLHIGGSELISFKVAVNEAVQQYGFPRSTAAAYVLNNIRDYNKIGGLKKELKKLTAQVVSVNEICFRQNKSMMTMLNLQSRGISEKQILQVNNFLEKNGYEIPINR
jgi:DNA repair ATPase RecN